MSERSGRDGLRLAVLNNRFEGIVRAMMNTLLRSARSAILNTARDFSCCILTGDNQLLASAEGLPVHIFGAHLAVRDRGQAPQPQSGATKSQGLRSATHRQTIDRAARRI